VKNELLHISTGLTMSAAPQFQSTSLATKVKGTGSPNSLGQKIIYGIAVLSL